MHQPHPIPAGGGRKNNARTRVPAMLRLPLAARCCVAPAAWCGHVPVLPRDGTLAAAKAVGAVKPQRTATPCWASPPHTPTVMSVRRNPRSGESRGGPGCGLSRQPARASGRTWRRWAAWRGRKCTDARSDAWPYCSLETVVWPWFCLSPCSPSLSDPSSFRRRGRPRFLISRRLPIAASIWA